MSIAEHEPSTDRSLLRRVQDGKQEAWQTFVQIYGPVVYRWLRKCDVQPADAADLMQETFLSASKSIQRFHVRSGTDKPTASLRPWLWTIARNKLRDLQRRRQKAGEFNGSEARIQIDNQQAASIPPEAAPTSEQDDRAIVRDRAIELIRDSFDPRSWKMFWETSVENRNPADVAAEMGVSRWAVYKARARVLQRLREETDGWGPSD